MTRLQKHHYIPEFYLRRWCGHDNRLCEFSRPWREVLPRRTYPGGTGYERGLYSLHGLPDAVKDVFETKFLSVADGRAAQTLQKMCEEEYVPTGTMKAPWTRFIMSVWYRTPQGMARIREKIREFYEEEDLEAYRADYARLRQSNDPETLDEYVAGTRAIK